MDIFRKAQVQAVSMVLIAGIVIALAGAAYFWGKPMIEKRSTMTDVSTAESFVLELDEKIVDVARNGGSKSVNLPRIPGAAVSVNDSSDGDHGNEILFRFLTSQPMLDMGENKARKAVETYDTEPVGEYGASPRIIMLESEPVENNQYLMTIRLTYRPLETSSEPWRGYRIEVVDGGTYNMDAPSRVVVSFLETVTGDRCSKDQCDITDTMINVTVS
jgi:hypothetical protein